MKATIEFPDDMYDSLCELLNRVDYYPTSITVAPVSVNDTIPRIGEEVFIHGYVDEVRKDTIIIRNEGGYFGTVREEVWRV